MKKFSIALACAAAALASGCAIHSGITEVDSNVFTISSLGNMGQPGDDLLDSLYESGKRYCDERHQSFKLLGQKTNNGTYRGNTHPFAGGSTAGRGWASAFNAGMAAFSMPMGEYGQARIYFTCVKTSGEPAAEGGEATAGSGS